MRRGIARLMLLFAPLSSAFLSSRCLRRAAAGGVRGSGFARASALPPQLKQLGDGDGAGGEGIVLVPEDGAYDHVVIMMHGLGDTASGWAPAMPALGLPRVKYVLPTAPTRPIALNGGMAMPGWFDLYGLVILTPDNFCAI